MILRIMTILIAAFLTLSGSAFAAGVTADRKSVV